MVKEKDDEIMALKREISELTVQILEKETLAMQVTHFKSQLQMA